MEEAVSVLRLASALGKHKVLPGIQLCGALISTSEGACAVAERASLALPGKTPQVTRSSRGPDTPGSRYRTVIAVRAHVHKVVAWGKHHVTPVSYTHLTLPTNREV